MLNLSAADYCRDFYCKINMQFTNRNAVQVDVSDMHQRLYLIMFSSIEGDNNYRKEMGLLLCISQNINFSGQTKILKNKILKLLKMRLNTQSAKFLLCLLPPHPEIGYNLLLYMDKKSEEQGNSQKKKIYLQNTFSCSVAHCMK